MIIVLLIISIYLYIISKTTNSKNILFAIPLIVIIITVVRQIKNLDTMLPDYQNYWWAFERAISGSTNYRYEIGYKTISQFFGYFGIGFPIFNEFLLIASFLILCISVVKFNGNIVAFLFLYFGSVFFIDIIQTRNTVAMTLILFFLSFQVKYGKSTYLWVIVAVLLSTLFQNIGIFFLILLPFIPKNMNKNKDKRVFKTIRVITNMVIFGFFLMVAVFPSILRNILLKMTMIVPNSYLESLLQATSVSTPFIMIVAIISIMMALYGHYVETIYGFQLKYNQLLLVQILKVQIYALPLLFVISDFQRAIRIGLVAMIMLHAILISNEKYRHNRALNLLMYSCYLLGSYELVWKLIFKSVMISFYQYWIN